MGYRRNERYDGNFIADLISEDKIEGILSWARDHTDVDFDTSFVEDMDDRLEEYGELTEGQDEALSNIIRSFRIPEEYF